MKKYNQHFSLDLFKEYLSWTISVLSAVIGLGFLSYFCIIEATDLNYAILFLASAILFCPALKFPNWSQFFVALALAVYM